ncbi:hypothetical protein SAMN05216570_0120 [Dyella sp. OK004]|uniref:HEAT repeat domain-containing protein n=1 Tax=Dyella sp. OK004 TaxID=1855292 RepID=UPI0008E67EC3|nr:HEAT repeat domain-containing protein [Dyella sp. OK004]SFR86601.1 hypothetical protein SAMN05216570_0120 [Dyella sp. OK004]
METAAIHEHVLRFQSPSSLEHEDVWQKLKPLGALVVPHFLEAYPKFRQARARVSLLFYATGFARISEEAFQLGVLGCKDRASLVRYRACGLLAYSLRPDALPTLHDLLTHTDKKTVEDAVAAMDAIRSGNYHYFIDRSHSGKTFWEVNRGDIPR